MINKTEILAPAGNMENLVAAVYSGANAVYLGVQSFNARASAANFSFEELKKAVGFYINFDSREQTGKIN